VRVVVVGSRERDDTKEKKKRKEKLPVLLS